MFEINIKEIRFTDIPLLEKIRDICINTEVIDELLNCYKYVQNLKNQSYYLYYPLKLCAETKIYVSVSDIIRNKIPLALLTDKKWIVCVLEEDYSTLKESPNVLANVFFYLPKKEIKEVAVNVITNIDYFKKFLKVVGYNQSFYYELIVDMIEETKIRQDIEEDEEILLELAKIEVILNPNKQIDVIIKNIDKQPKIRDVYSMIRTGRKIIEEKLLNKDNLLTVSESRVVDIYNAIEDLPTSMERHGIKKDTISLFLEFCVDMYEANILKIEGTGKQKITKKIINKIKSTKYFNDFATRAVGAIPSLVNELPNSIICSFPLQFLLGLYEYIKNENIIKDLRKIKKIQKISYCKEVWGSINSFYIGYNEQLFDIIRDFDLEKALSPEGKEYLNAICSTVNIINRPAFTEFLNNISEQEIENILKIFPKKQE